MAALQPFHARLALSKKKEVLALFYFTGSIASIPFIKKGEKNNNLKYFYKRFIFCVDQQLAQPALL
ncbi:MAG: hypothetical protein LUF30_08865 [Lachnospiraceae bacterium]|nr:hypothetical protein [Lachnospiraceae bacterium]